MTNPRPQKGKLREDSSNEALGRALAKCNGEWAGNIHVERQRGDGKRIDIEIDARDMPAVAIEAAYGGDDCKDALARLHDADLDFETAIAVAIPESFQDYNQQQAEDALDAGAEIGYAVVQKAGDDGVWRFPQSGYIGGTVRDLAAFVSVASVSKDRVADVADKVVASINTAADELMKLPQDDIENIAGLMGQQAGLSAVKITAVLWLDALLVQACIRRGTRGIESVPSSHGEILPSRLVATWREILHTNWNSVFEPAVYALEKASVCNAEVSAALRHLIDAVEIINAARLGRHINVGAEIFPKIADDRKESAAFYTAPATAEMLAAMTIRRDDRDDWRRDDLFAGVKAADFACGTGTLLRAAVQRITTFHMGAGGNVDSLNALYQSAIEEGVVGLDISPIAAHLTVSSLALAGTGLPHGKAAIGCAGVGDPDQTGSLELFEASRVSDDIFGRAVQPAGGENGANFPFEVGDGRFDYVLMNPPYSRTRGGQSAFDLAGLSDAEQAACQARWGELIRDEAAERQAGMAASFLCLAKNKLRGGGRLGFVLPLTAAFSSSWAKTRAMLVTEFDDIIAVSVPGMASKEKGMSADTGMGEMLLVATKRAAAGVPAPVMCVNLRAMPAHNGEAGEVGRSAMRAVREMRDEYEFVRAGDSELGGVMRFDPAEAGDVWSHLSTRNMDLARVALQLAKGRFGNLTVAESAAFNCPIVAMEDLFEVGPSHDQLGHPLGGDGRGAYRFDPVSGATDAVGSNRALWMADGKNQTRLIVSPTHKGAMTNAEMAERVCNKRGTLHYSRQLRWTSQQLIAAITAFPVFGGSAWTTLLSDDEQLLRAFALWANSTAGAIVRWVYGGRTQPGRAMMQVKAIQRLPVPDLRRLPRGKLPAAAERFDAFASRELKRLTLLHSDSVRHEIDRAVFEMLELPYDEPAMHQLRLAFCSEPSVHGNNKTAIEALRDAGVKV